MMKLSDVAQRLGCEIQGNSEILITGISSIDQAGPTDLTFVANKKYLAKLSQTKAAAVILSQDDPEVKIPSLRTSNPYLAFARALELFYPPYVPPEGIDPTAVISPTTRIGAHASIGPYVVIGDEVVIGDYVRLFAHVVIYPKVQIGHHVTAHAGAVIREGTRIGNRVILQSGVVVGGDGFGYVPLPKDVAYKIPQAGIVVLEDDVEIGSNTTIDRATIGATVIRKGAKIDNLVMIGHGCEVGEGAFLAAQVGLSGSTKLGERVQMGGQVGTAGHLTVGNNTMVAAQSGIPNDVPANSIIGGYPAVDIRSWRRYVAALPKLPEIFRRLRRVERVLGLQGERSEE
jgi:UDP-3-O-[3-hydroxymyristoyl] glucosamine N-acyltransferase